MARTKRQEIARCARIAIPAMQLEHWDITLSFVEKIGGGDSAECYAQPEYKQAVLRFVTAKIEWDDIARFVVHELDHCHVEPLGAIAVLAAGEDKAKQEWVRRTEEGLVTEHDQIITALLFGERGTNKPMLCGNCSRTAKQRATS